jgi:DNA-binding MarR family transcriptional regulator
MTEERRPIGYWLKHLDGLIEGTFERTLASEGLTRRHWQVLNALHNGLSTQSQVADALEPFLADDPGAGRAVVRDLIAKEWVEPGRDGTLALSAAGIRAHADLMERVKATRQLVVRGITEDEYRTVIDILRRMAENLEQASA